MTGDFATRVVVTGASGFVAQHTIRALEAAGFICDAAPSAHELLHRDPRTASSARAHLARQCAGAGTLVHLAGRAHVTHETAADAEAEFVRGNVELVTIVVSAAAATPIRRALLLSSVAAVRSQSHEPLTERSACEPDGLYGRSKLEGERRFAALCAGAGIAGTILRAPMIYGPGMKGNPLRLLNALRRGIPLPLGSMHNPRSVAYVGNVVAAIVQIVRVAATPSLVYNVADSDSVSTTQFVRNLGLAIGVRALLIPIPIRCVAWAAHISPALPYARRVSSLAAPLQRAAARLELDTSAIAREVGFCPPFSMAEGISETARWYSPKRDRSSTSSR